MQPAEIVRNFSGLLASIQDAANISVQANETVTEILQQVLLHSAIATLILLFIFLH